jgi:hypothetical protein
MYLEVINLFIYYIVYRQIINKRSCGMTLQISFVNLTSNLVGAKVGVSLWK